jgi:hypothetical protein
MALKYEPRAGQHTGVTTDAAVKIAYPEKFHIFPREFFMLLWFNE